METWQAHSRRSLSEGTCTGASFGTVLWKGTPTSASCLVVWGGNLSWGDEWTKKEKQHQVY